MTATRTKDSVQKVSVKKHFLEWSHPLRPEWSPRFRRVGISGSGSLPSAVTELPQSPRGGRPH